MRSSLLIVAAVAALAACADSPTQSSEAPLFAKIAGPAQIEGEIGPGALYGLSVPDEWNGDLVLYAHGYVPPVSPVELQDVSGEGGDNPNAFRDALLDLGYGVAYSSFSENGYAVREGLTQTRQLRGLFASRVGKPNRTYVVGKSLGGLISLMAAEKHPDLFDGALPMCGLVGGGPLEIDYIYDVRVLFDYFYPGVLPSNALDVPDGTNPYAYVGPVIAAISANPLPAVDLAAVDQVDLPYASFPQLINSVLNALFFNLVATADLSDRTGGGFFDNSSTVYTGSSDDGALNEGVDRFEGTPRGRNYLENWYLPEGDLKLPVLTLHTAMDPVVPLFHEPAYAGIVAAAGRSDLLVQRTIPTYGHCAFTLDEQVQAFQDLVTWAENGVIPAP